MTILDRKSTLQTDRERIAELEEEIRQLRKAFTLAPVRLPLSWKLDRAERLLLFALIRWPTVSHEQYPLIMPPRNPDRSNERGIITQIGKLRRKLRALAPEVRIVTMHRHGCYYINQVDKYRLVKMAKRA